MKAALAIGITALLLHPAAALGQESNAYERGVEARLAGDPATATGLLEEWLADHPADVDARVQLGYAYLALDRLDAAESQFRAALTRSPDYADASSGLDLVERRRTSATRTGFFLVEGSVSTLGNGLRDWSEVDVLISVPIADRDTLDVRGNRYRRFGLEDVELGALYTHRADNDTWLRFGGSATPSADYRPEVGVTVGIDRRLSGGPGATVIGADAAWRSFPLQDVFNLSPAVTQYLGGAGDFSVTARANVLAADGDSLRIGGTLRGDYAPGNRTRAFLGVAAGPDTDVGLVTDTYSIFGGGEVPVADGLSITGSAAREWRDGPADRTEFRLGLKVGL